MFDMLESVQSFWVCCSIWGQLLPTELAGRCSPHVWRGRAEIIGSWTCCKARLVSCRLFRSFYIVCVPFCLFSTYCIKFSSCSCFLFVFTAVCLSLLFIELVCLLYSLICDIYCLLVCVCVCLRLSSFAPSLVLWFLSFSASMRVFVVFNNLQCFLTLFSSGLF